MRKEISDLVRPMSGEGVSISFCDQDVLRDGPFWFSGTPLKKGDIVVLHSRRKNGKPKQLKVIATTRSRRRIGRCV